MKWNVTLRGHNVQVELTDAVGREEKGGFYGVLISSEYGRSLMTNCRKDGERYLGDVAFDGHSAHVEAWIGNAGQLNGVVHVGWFVSVDFTGTPIKEG